MTEEQKSVWNVTWWIVYVGTPGSDGFQIVGGGKSEKDALRNAMANGLPAGAKTGQLKERAVS